ncbi:MarR family winged helix-turn-helix transcriptional regulator [Desertibaculum subflavum]|uniref:MarR family winged helix-turn-helix transcriptional regulator n=1 Tax=Desertibaculum subflavum TaxID=2268458 RepID=UPI000E6668E1
MNPAKPTIARGLLPELIGYRLRRAQVRVFNDFLASLAPFELTPGLFGVLVLIDSNPGLNQSRLGNAMGVDRSTVVAVIDRLQARGLVARKPSTSDRRAHRLTLTPKGKSALEAAVPEVRAHEARIAEALTTEERAALLQLLEKLAP